MVLEKIENAEWGAADGEDVHAAVAVALDDVEDFRGAADARQTFGHGKQHAEFGFLREAIFDHGAVTRLKNVQGKLRAGKKDDVQRKKRNAFWPHGVPDQMIPEEPGDVWQGLADIPAGFQGLSQTHLLRLC